MTLIVHILDTSTGQLATTDRFSDLPFNRYWWEDGNASCDCNRGLFFARAKGLDDPDCECGEDRYKVQIVCDGEIVYDELPGPLD